MFGLSIAGIALLGFSIAFIFVPLLAEIIAAVAEKEKIDNNPFLSDRASGLYNTAYGIGNFLAPLVGSSITRFTDFRKCCDVMGCASLLLFFVYFSLAILPGILEKRRILKEEQ